MNLNFTQEELNVQIQLNDLAIKAGGLQVAEAAVVLTKKYQEALQEKKEPNPSTKIK